MCHVNVIFLAIHYIRTISEFTTSVGSTGFTFGALFGDYTVVFGSSQYVIVFISFLDYLSELDLRLWSDYHADS